MSNLNNTNNINPRECVDLAISHIFNPRKNDFLRFTFYGYILAQCKITVDETFKGIAGVRFNRTHYHIIINPIKFSEFNIKQQVAILIHESMHIIYNHVGRKEDRDHELFNVASDCAINQQITREFLGDLGVFPDTLSKELQIKVPQDKSAEYYYDLIYESIPPCEHCSGTGKIDGEVCEHCDGSGKNTIKKYVLDNHDVWDESEGNNELRKAITKTMIKNSINSNRGNAPLNISAILDLYEDDSKVSWQNELKDIMGNRKANKTRTIMRPNRRQPSRIELKGNKKSTTFTLIAIVDVSGSMSNDMILNGLNELHHICKLTGTSLKLIQVDTEVHSIETFDKNTKLLNRSGQGGTVMEPAIDYIQENKIEHDVIVLITDSYIEDISRWKNPPRCKMLFLVTTDGSIPGIDAYPMYKQFNIMDK